MGKHDSGKSKPVDNGYQGKHRSEGGGFHVLGKFTKDLLSGKRGSDQPQPEDRGGKGL